MSATEHGRSLSAAQLDEMAELREQGWSLRRIAEHFTARGTKVHQSTIGWQCMRIGADLPPHRRGRAVPRTQPMMRNGHVIRPFTPEEDQKLLELDTSGATMRQMCEALGRKNNSVRGRLMTLARHDARAAGE